MISSIDGQYEAEIKIPIDDPEDAKSRIIKIGGQPRFLDNLESDVCLDYPDASLASKQQELILRSRLPLGEFLLLLKDSQANSIDLTVVADYGTTLALLKKLGFITILDFTKTRSMFLKDSYHLVVDTLDGQGSYIEVGSTTNDPSELLELKKQVEDVATSIGYSIHNRELRSYRELIRLNSNPFYVRQ